MFHYNYLMKVLLLPGQIETYPVIMDFNGLGIASLPRETIISLGKFVNYNIMYHLSNAYVVHVSFGMNMFYKGVSFMISPETKAKNVISRVKDPPELKKMYHPS